ncbi:MAG: hypothetical protein AMXMBFR80_08070 [Dehalococcoidia bacterium]
MREMTARQPRRSRRRVAAPAATLPRPVAGSEAEGQGVARSARRAAPAHHREHHVTRDYSHVKKDLLTILIVGVGSIGFIVGMSFVVQSSGW